MFADKAKDEDQDGMIEEKVVRFSLQVPALGYCS
jgi:hypothetical protein